MGMLSILNETKTKVFQQEQLTVRIFPSIQEMGSVAAKEVGDQICRLLESKPEINMIFAAAPSQNEFLSHLIHDKRIDWTRINADLLTKHPVDIVCLGIGENGHIAFNDPDVADFNDPKLVKVVELDPICRQQQVNEKCFKTLDLVPKEALTLTIPALLKAEWMFCIVPFKNKAQAVYQTVYGEVSEKCPASILRRKENSSLYLDPESAERINL